MDSIESLEVEQHVGTYIRVVALCLEDVRGRVVHGNGGGCCQHGHTIDNKTTAMR